MHMISGRYRAPKTGSSKRRKSASQNAIKRWHADSTVAAPSVPVPENSFEENFKVKETECTYVIMGQNMWSELLKNLTCSTCTENYMNVVARNNFGFSTKLELVCTNCSTVHGSTFSSSREESSKMFEINKKVTKAFTSIGKGHAAIETVSMIIGFPSMDKKTFYNCLDSVILENQTLKREVLERSRDLVRKKHIEADPCDQNKVDTIDICVSYDGTWQKRGHSSLYGIGVVIDVHTNLVIDYEILSKYCHECNIAVRDLGEDTAEFHFWHEGHFESCQMNYSGSSNSMECEIATILWLRSIKIANVRYTKMLSDGDAKTQIVLNELKVYGGDLFIEKEECLNHVSKRLGTALRKKIVEWRGKGHTLGGKKTGSLKPETIGKLQNFYRNAIEKNAPNVEAMKTAVFATLFHCMSSDNKPQHGKCPKGKDSWCFFQRSAAKNEVPPSHTTMKTKLSEEVVEKILPVYQRLASTQLLQRCTAAKTQNANESLHSCIWNKCSKETFVSKERLDLAVVAAISEFNFGHVQSLEMASQVCCLKVGEKSFFIAEQKDKRRSYQRARRVTPECKSKRIQKKYSKRVIQKTLHKKEGVTYAAGNF